MFRGLPRFPLIDAMRKHVFTDMRFADLLGGSHRVLVAHGEAALFIATRNIP
jgi:hypothetical protein